MTSTFVSCSEDRVALARRGALAADEWQDFATHLTACVDCRLAWRLAVDFEHSGDARAGDERIVARGVKAALASSARPRKPRLRFVFAAAVILLAAGAASAAIVLHVRHRQAAEPSPLPSDPRLAQPRASRVAALPRVPVESPPASTVELRPEPEIQPAPTPPSASAAPASPRAETGRPRTLASPREQVPLDPFEHGARPTPAPPPIDPRALLARGVAERRDGHIDAAIATFRQLQRELPDSSEATVSLVSLGHLLLADGQPAEALRAFERYLRLAPGGALVPEAWVGKARALTAMGRATEASAAWDEIGKRFPGSGYLRP